MAEDALAGKVALVTGAGSGIGAAAAALLAHRGAAVGVLSRTDSEVEKVVHAIEKNGGRAMALTADVRDEKGVSGCVDELVARFGGLDVVVANAGINGAAGPIEELTVRDCEETVGINLVGTFVTLRVCTPHLRKRGKGSVIVTSSVNGNVLFSDPGTCIYSSTKAAQVAMVKLLALDLARSKVRINAVLPGSIETRIDDNSDKRNADAAAPRVKYPDGEIPLTGKQPGRPEQVARLIAFLASDDSDHITGAEIVIDGGQSLMA